MVAKCFVDGAAGTTGLEITERLTGRGDIELIVLDEAQRKHTLARRDAFNAADIAILCLPDDAARDAVAMLDPASTTRVIDASSAHRTAPGWTYGFPELVGRNRVAEARFISNPGCYPTGFLALIAPLFREGLLPADWPYTVNAVSGYSGGGKALIERFEHDTEIAYRAYGLSLDHKHLEEMRVHGGLRHAPVFSPSVISAFRGMLVDVPLPLAAMGVQPVVEDLRRCLADAYADQPTIYVVDEEHALVELLLSRDAAPWDGMELHVFGAPDCRQARLVARFDNLGKGASGAAVQTLNLMLGVGEYTGLRLTP